MAGTAQAAERNQCERCSGHYVVDASSDGTPRVRCNKCGHLREVAEPSPASVPGKWTVIGPDGKAMSFDSWEELTESRRPSAITTSAQAIEETKEIPRDRKSASALLDFTPAPMKNPQEKSQKLALADMDSALDLGEISAKPRRPSLTSTLTPGSSKPASEKLEPLLVRSFAPKAASAPPKVEWAPRIDNKKPEVRTDQENTLRVELAPAPVTARVIEADRPTARNVAAPPDSMDELDPDALIDEEEDEDAAPLSLRDAMPDSSGDILGDDDLEEEVPDPHELLSIRDLVVVPATGDTSPSPAQVRTAPMPSVAPRASAPPPAPAIAKSLPPPRPQSLSRPDARPEPTPSRPPQVSTIPPAANRAVDDMKRRAATRASVAPEPPKRGWILGVVAILVLGGVAWRLLSSDPTTPQPKPTPTVATAPPTPVTTPSPTNVTPPPPDTVTVLDPTPTPTTTTTQATTAPTPTTPPAEKPTVATTPVQPTGDKPPATATTTATTTSTPKPTVAVTDAPGSMSDLLDKAGAARRKGDYATARDLYQRVVTMSPGNVEANGGLGDVARAQGDLGAAKASYERALAASAAYTPALLGLADVEWDQGNKVSATKRYAAVVDRMGDRAPARAKERANTGN